MMVLKKLIISFVALCALDLASAQNLQAIAYVRGGNPSIKGNVTFSQNDNGLVTFWGKIEGLGKGKRGFHIHEKGDITGGCETTGSHYNPFKKTHGALTDAERHVGDLGNIITPNDGTAVFTGTDDLISLKGPYSILGRAVVIHANEDDLGKGRFSDSLTTGHAGGRVACGVIGILTPTESWPQESSAGSLTSGAVILLASIFMQRLLH